MINVTKKITTKITARAIIIILLAACFYFYEFIIQITPGVAQQHLMRDFAINATKFGILSGCFYLFYTPFMLPAGLLLDRYSTRVILTCVCTVFSIGVLIFAYAPNFYVAAIARFIMGGAASYAFISVLHLTAHWIPPVHFALFAGITEMMGSFGGAIGTEPLAMLLDRFGWRSTMIGFAYAGFILAILIALIVRNRPIDMENKNKNTNSIWLDLKTIMHKHETWSIGAYSFFVWGPVLAFSALWGVAFLRLSHNLDNVAAARAIAFAWIGICFASPVIGWLSDFIGRRCIIMTVCAFIGTVAMSAIIYINNINIIILYILMLAIGFASSGQTLSFALIKDNSLPHTNGIANGFNNMILVASGLLFQPLIGKILDIFWQGAIQDNVYVYSLYSYKIAFSILAICYFFAALISILFIKETRCIAKT